VSLKPSPALGAVRKTTQTRRRRGGLSTKAGYKRLSGCARPEASRVDAILELLDLHYGHPECALLHESPFQLLIATILSAQCTDERVNLVTPELFACFPDAESMSEASLPELERLVHSTGFFRNKARNIRDAAQLITHTFGGELPREIETFVTIPGAARKTANVVLGTAFGIASGVVVDTHVMRLTRRWGFHRLSDARQIEKLLVELLPQDRWIEFSHQVIWHGRRVCKARTPACEGCAFLPHCPEGALLLKES